MAPQLDDSDAVTLVQRFGHAANLDIHLHRLALDGVPKFVEAPAPTDDALHMVLHKSITRTRTSSRRCAPS